jgi:hypothetical protein
MQIIHEMQIKATLRFHLSPVRMANHQENEQQVQVRM